MSDIDDYIAACASDVQPLLEQVREAIRRAAPAAAEAIKYGIPTFVQGENLVHFAAFKKHIGFYPTSSAVTAFEPQLQAYKRAKGSIQFPLDEPMPIRLIEQIVKFRVREATRKATLEIAPKTTQKATQKATRKPTRKATQKATPRA